MGNVLQAGVGPGARAPGRASPPGIPDTVPATTVNKVCGSGLKAVIAAAQAIALGDAEVVVAGGMESMSNAPYLSLTACGSGARMGNVELKDAHDPRRPLGPVQPTCTWASAPSRAPRTARSPAPRRTSSRSSPPTAPSAPRRKGCSRRRSSRSRCRRRRATRSWSPTTRAPRTPSRRRSPTLKPVFKKDGTVTAANASSINDGAAALVLMSAERAKAEGTHGPRPHRRLRQRGPQAGGVHHRPGRRDQASCSSGRSTTAERRRPLGDQRGLRGGRHRQQPAPQARPVAR